MPGRRLFLAGGALLGLSGCGFRPVYMRTASGGPGVAQRELAAVAVDIIPDRPGQLLRQALQRRLEGSGTGVARAYDLSVSFSISGEGIAIQTDNSVTRLRFIGRSSWVLRAEDPAQTRMASGAARFMDGLNILDQQYFASDLETEQVQGRIAEEIADQITIQLAAFFRRRAAEMAAKAT